MTLFSIAPSPAISANKFSDSNRVRLTVRSNSSFAGTPGPTLQGPSNPAASDALHILAAGLNWDSTPARTGNIS